MVAASCLVLALPSALGQVGVIVAAGVLGLLLFKPEQDAPHEPLPIIASRRAGSALLLLFVLLLLVLPIVTQAWPGSTLAMIDAFYRSGALVFGGGHVVLPLLQAEVVPTGWVSNTSFLAGYGAAQAVPGPLFTFAAFLGASMNAGAKRLAWRPDLPGRGFRTVVPARHRCAALLGAAAAQPPHASGADRHQCRSRRSAPGGAVSAGMDQRHTPAGRFWPGADRTARLDVLEAAAVAGGDGERACRLAVEQSGRRGMTPGRTRCAGVCRRSRNG
jgi:hypothetical protein